MPTHSGHARCAHATTKAGRNFARGSSTHVLRSANDRKVDKARLVGSSFLSTVTITVRLLCFSSRKTFYVRVGCFGHVVACTFFPSVLTVTSPDADGSEAKALKEDFQGAKP